MRMCNRFSLTAELPDLMDRFGIDRVHVPYFRRYNIAPTQQIPVIQQIGEERCLNQQRWGLMPYWGKNSVNANLETLGNRPYLRSMVAKKRCVVPCSGFYVWKQGAKTVSAWHVVHRTKMTFAMPGIFDVWLDSERNEFPMCTVITSGAAFETDHLLPLVLDEDSMEQWLDARETRPDALESLLRKLPEADFRIYPVSPSVTNMTLETPECILELDEKLPLVKV